MATKVKVEILYGEEFAVHKTVEWLKPVSLPTMHSVGVTQEFQRSDGTVITASKLAGQSRWVHDKVVR